MAITHVTTKAYKAGASGGTSDAHDFTGCNFLVVALSDYSLEAEATFTDSLSNTWNFLTARIAGAGAAARIRIGYATNATVGAAQTFTATNGGTSFSCFVVNGFAGVATSSPFDVQNGATNDASASTIATGSVTPSEANCLVIYGAAGQIIGISSVDIGTLAGTVAGESGQAFGVGAGYQIQTTATARNPTFTFSGANDKQCAAIAVFKAAAAAGGVARIMGGQIIGGNLVNGGLAA